MMIAQIAPASSDVAVWSLVYDRNCYPGHGADDLERPKGTVAGTMTLAVCQASCQGTVGCTGITICRPPDCYGSVPTQSGAHVLCYRRSNVRISECEPSGVGYGKYQTFLLDRTSSPPVPTPSSWDTLEGLNCYAGNGALDLETPAGSNAGVMSIAACKAACIGTPPCSAIAINDSHASGRAHVACYRRDQVQPSRCPSGTSYSTLKCDAPPPPPAELSLPRHSVSGMSAGGSMAVNHLVAFSSHVVGAGIIAGNPYGCTAISDDYGDICGAETSHNASYYAARWNSTWLPQMESYIRRRASLGAIDAVSNLTGRRVYLFSGTHDTVVNQETMRALLTQLSAYGVSGILTLRVQLGVCPIVAVLTRPAFEFSCGTVHPEFGIPAEHAWVVGDDVCNEPGAQSPTCGRAHGWPATAAKPTLEACCGTCAAGEPPEKKWWWPDVVNCHYDMSGTMFRWILGSPLSERTRATLSNFRQFKQTSYMPSGHAASAIGFADVGYVYVPTKCAGERIGSCRVHVDYHGFGNGYLYTKWHSAGMMLQTGSVGYAEANELVLLFPQAGERAFQSWYANCWDFWGSVTGDAADGKHGLQLQAVAAMLADIAGLVRDAIPVV